MHQAVDDESISMKPSIKRYLCALLPTTMAWREMQPEMQAQSTLESREQGRHERHPSCPQRHQRMDTTSLSDETQIIAKSVERLLLWHDHIIYPQQKYVLCNGSSHELQLTVNLQHLPSIRVLQITPAANILSSPQGTTTQPSESF